MAAIGVFVVALLATGAPSAVAATKAVLVKDINPDGGSYPGDFTDVDGTAFFTAYNERYGAELWKSDGTPGGTRLVKDIATGVDRFNNSNPSELTNVDGTLFFDAVGPVGGHELWKSDGTAAGTVIVKDINPGFSSSNPADLTAVGGTLFFSADDGIHGRELWKSDGTAAGTTMVANINQNPIAGGTDEGSGPNELTNVNGTLFFLAFDGIVRDPDYGQSGAQLWKSDGTSTGTVTVAFFQRNSFINQLTAVGDLLFFSGYTIATGKEPWRSDGTTAGTFLIKDLQPGSEYSWPSALVGVNGNLFFGARAPAGGVWTSDGTEAGTSPLGEVAMNDSEDTPHQAAAGGLFFFDGSGLLWRSDGTPQGTFALRDFGQSGPSGPYDITGVNSIAFFRAFDPTRGVELWRSDGSVRGTVLVADIAPGSASSDPAWQVRHPPIRPTTMLGVEGTLFFTADDGVHGYELWKTKPRVKQKSRRSPKVGHH
jgi:ELWxxDGT repeat protein